MRLLQRLTAAAVALLLCTAAHAAELTVAAAASLTDAFKAIAPLFEAHEPGTTVRLTFGASGALLQQIANGAPVDVFASADADTMDRAQARALVRGGDRRVFARNSLVVVVPATSDAVPLKLADLARPAYARIAIGQPDSVPAGRYARGVLDRAALWPALERRVVPAHSVRQVLDYVARGEADAGFVYATDAALMPGRVKVALTVPTAAPVVYPIAPVAGGRNAAAAERFVAFVLSAPAQAVLARHGFDPKP